MPAKPPPLSPLVDPVEFIGQLPSAFDQEIRRYFPIGKVFGQFRLQLFFVPIECLTGLTSIEVCPKILAGLAGQLVVKKKDNIVLAFSTVHRLY